MPAMRRRDALLTLASCATLPMTAAATAPSTLVYVGSYGPKGRGIHRFALDPASGALREQGLTTSTLNPSWLVLNAAGTRLYSANEGGGSVGAYALAADGTPQAPDMVTSGGAGPVHLSLHPGGRHLLVANYGGASVAVLTLDGAGRPGAASDVQAAPRVAAPLHGARSAALAPPGSFAISGHDAPHMHMVQVAPSGRFVLACELGQDLLVVWRFDAETGRLLHPQVTATSPGAGPRHLVFHPHHSELCYVLNEEASTLAWYRLDAEAGRLLPLGEASSLPAGFRGTSFAAGLLIAPEGRRLYALNRLHDSIACFDLDAVNGRPRLAAVEWTRGSYPRSLGLDPSGRWLIVCNERSDHLAVFGREPDDGGLQFAEQYAAVGSPNSLAFLSRS